MRMHPLARPRVSTLGRPFCCNISPGAVRRSSALTREMPARTTRSSRKEVRTRHQAPRCPFPQETNSLGSCGSPSEMSLTSSSSSSNVSGTSWRGGLSACAASAAACAAACATAHWRASKALSRPEGNGLASSSDITERRTRRCNKPYSRFAGAQDAASKVMAEPVCGCPSRPPERPCAPCIAWEGGGALHHCQAAGTGES
mmetsp:Transcript_37938/g.80658  ORF Transcript_37938/g.80658 Transcript_37938/m.80658 type:complete len:201 (+) Transcript_37938:500-1102(+)